MDGCERRQGMVYEGHAVAQPRLQTVQARR